jgi:ring-1,2-phenylacetyl-CoA epoxidase subunit PaaE
MPTETTAEVTEVAIMVHGSVRIVSVADDETILEAGLRAGIDLPWACGVGVCGTCSARLIEGSVNREGNVGGSGGTDRADLSGGTDRVRCVGR